MPILKEMPGPQKPVPAQALKYGNCEDPPPKPADPGDIKENERVPADWHPGRFKEYKVQDGDNWWTVAARHNVDLEKLIRFNFHTAEARYINWYLREYVGCDHRTEDGKNWVFTSSIHANPRNVGKKRAGVIYIPLQDDIVVEDDTVTGESKWKRVGISLADVDVYEVGYKLGGVKYLRGKMVFREVKVPGMVFKWDFSIPLVGISAEQAGKGVKIGKTGSAKVGDFITNEKLFWWDLGLFDPRTYWNGKQLYMEMAGYTLKVGVMNAFPQKPNPSWRPVMYETKYGRFYHEGFALNFKLTMKSEPEWGIFIGPKAGSLSNGRYDFARAGGR